MHKYGEIFSLKLCFQFLEFWELKLESLIACWFYDKIFFQRSHVLFLLCSKHRYFFKIQYYLLLLLMWIIPQNMQQNHKKSKIISKLILKICSLMKIPVWKCHRKIRLPKCFEIGHTIEHSIRIVGSTFLFLGGRTIIVTTTTYLVYHF